VTGELGPFQKAALQRRPELVGSERRRGHVRDHRLRPDCLRPVISVELLRAITKVTKDAAYAEIESYKGTTLDMVAPLSGEVVAMNAFGSLGVRINDDPYRKG
jgi:Glycine cleavage H-protein